MTMYSKSCLQHPIAATYSDIPGLDFCIYPLMITFNVNDMKLITDYAFSAGSVLAMTTTLGLLQQQECKRSYIVSLHQVWQFSQKKKASALANSVKSTKDRCIF